MKRVLLMRHAKSSWAQFDLTDHQRPLNDRGRRDTPRIARELVKRKLLPELIISSDSTRTRETYKLLSTELNMPVEFTRNLYLATADELFRTIQQANNQYDTIMILAHNPGITEVFEKLAKVYIDNVPTAGLGCIRFDVDRFDEITPHSGKLDYFVYPKML